MKDNGRVVRVLADRWSNHRLYIHNGENKRELKRIAPNCVNTRCEKQRAYKKL